MSDIVANVMVNLWTNLMIIKVTVRPTLVLIRAHMFEQFSALDAPMVKRLMSKSGNALQEKYI